MNHRGIVVVALVLLLSVGGCGEGRGSGGAPRADKAASEVESRVLGTLRFDPLSTSLGSNRLGELPLQVAFHSGGARVDVVGEAGRLSTWEVPSGRLVAEHAAGGPPVRFLARVDENRALVSRATGTQEEAHPLFGGDLWDLALREDGMSGASLAQVADRPRFSTTWGGGERIAVATDRGSVSVGDLAEKDLAFVEAGQVDSLVALSGDAEDRLIAVTRQGAVLRYDAERAALVRVARLAGIDGFLVGEVSCIAGRVLAMRARASGEGPFDAQLWDLASEDPRPKTLAVPSACFALAQSKNLIVALSHAKGASERGALTAFDPETAEVRWSTEVARTTVGPLFVSPGADVILVGDVRVGFDFYSATSGERLSGPREGRGHTRTLALSSRGLLSAPWSEGVYLSDPRDLREARRLPLAPEPDAYVGHVAWGPEGGVAVAEMYRVRALTGPSTRTGARVLWRARSASNRSWVDSVHNVGVDTWLTHAGGRLLLDRAGERVWERSLKQHEPCALWPGHDAYVTADLVPHEDEDGISMSIEVHELAVDTNVERVSLASRVLRLSAEDGAAISAMTFSADGALMLILGATDTLELWRPGEPWALVRRHTLEGGTSMRATWDSVSGRALLWGGDRAIIMDASGDLLASHRVPRSISAAAMHDGVVVLALATGELRSYSLRAVGGK